MNENCFSVTYSAVPTEVDSYHSLFPLEPLPPPNRIQKSSNFGYITSCYKAVNSKDDLPYCLRRIHGKEDGPLCQECITWAKIVHTLLETGLYLSHPLEDKKVSFPLLLFLFSFFLLSSPFLSLLLSFFLSFLSFFLSPIENWCLTGKINHFRNLYFSVIYGWL